MKRFARIIVDIHNEKLDRPFTYRVPDGMYIDVGSRVVVPFGARRLEGYCVGFEDAEEAEGIKDIEDVLDEQPLLTEELVELADWGARHWFCTRIHFLQAMIPPGIRWTTRKWVSLSGEAGDSRALQYLREKEAVRLSEWLKVFPEVDETVLRRLRQSGTIEVRSLEKKGVGKKTVRVAVLVSPAPAVPVSGKKQDQLLQLLGERGPTAMTELAKAGYSAATVRGLVRKGLVEIREEAVARNPLSGDDFQPDQAPPLTALQSNALATIRAAREGEGPCTVLLHGVTGSGKTEVYLQAIAGAMAEGLGSIVLVPEIALTPQMVERFASRFGSRVAVLHSRLSAGERYDEWCRVAAGEALVVVGARSAVFAPFRRLGLIILDEEHEPAYKQEETPRYHARDVALRRAAKHRAAVVLGSATPSVETYRQAELGNFKLCGMPERIGDRVLPPVRVVDMRLELKAGHKSIFSRPLLAGLDDVLKNGKQAILFLNRRGFATFVLCRECGHVMRCAVCNVSLKFHSTGETLRCHYCDHGEAYPQVCPQCKGRGIRHFGTGTQKVESELLSYFPGVRVSRLDADTTGKKGAYGSILGAFRKGETDVLVGTQMVAKGLDFPNVTLVGVITADTVLNLPDFRAGERTFQLLTQVSGRAGRGDTEGQVVVQTYTPEHYAVQAASGHDYETFYRQEIKARQELGYPPYTRLIRILVTGNDEKGVIAAAHEAAAGAAQFAECLGPSPCPIDKICGQFRWHLIVRSGALKDMAGGVERLLGNLRHHGVRIVVDVDPQSLL